MLRRIKKISYDKKPSLETYVNTYNRQKLNIEETRKIKRFINKIYKNTGLDSRNLFVKTDTTSVRSYLDLFSLQFLLNWSTSVQVVLGNRNIFSAKLESDLLTSPDLYQSPILHLISGSYYYRQTINFVQIRRRVWTNCNPFTENSTPHNMPLGQIKHMQMKTKEKLKQTQISVSSMTTRVENSQRLTRTDFSEKYLLQMVINYTEPPNKKMVYIGRHWVVNNIVNIR